jgi:hypothetical protein
MKKLIYALVLPLVVVSGLVFANRNINKEPTKQSASKPLTAAEINAERRKWESTPGGIQYKKWEASPAGKKVLGDAAKISKHINASTNMEAIVTSLSLPRASRLGFGVMVTIDSTEYILRFDAEKSQLEQLHSLKVNDRIIVRSRNVSHAPKYAFPIIGAEYVERDKKVIFKRIPPKDGC